MAEIDQLYRYSYKNPHTQNAIIELVNHMVVGDPRAETSFANMLWAVLTQECHELCSYFEAIKVADMIVEDMKIVLFDANSQPLERWYDGVWDYMKYIINTCAALHGGHSGDVIINIVGQNYGGNVGGSGNNVW